MEARRTVVNTMTVHNWTRKQSGIYEMQCDTMKLTIIRLWRTWYVMPENVTKLNVISCKSLKEAKAYVSDQLLAKGLLDNIW